jgi:hypothetical protein
VLLSHTSGKPRWEVHKIGGYADTTAERQRSSTMSRLYMPVSPEKIENVFGIVFTTPVLVAYGYDHPLHDYFLEIVQSDDSLPTGLHYGGFSYTEACSRTEFIDASRRLGLFGLSYAVTCDMPI